MSDVKHRVMIERDPFASAPEDYLAIPIIWVAYTMRGRSGKPVQGEDYLPDSSVFDRAIAHVGWEQMERWARIFLGPVRQLRDYQNRDGHYLAIATQEWYDALGEWEGKPTREELVAQHTEYEDYLSDDVFVLTPQIQEMWVKLDRDRVHDSDGQYVKVMPDDEAAVKYEWVHDPDGYSIGGFYGEEHAKEAALSEFYNKDDVDFIVVDEDGNEV